MITHLELKNFLLNNVADCIGTYTTPSAQTMKAIALLPHPDDGYYFPPNTWKVEGIEAVIVQPVREKNNTRQMIAGDLGCNDNWKIFLKEHNHFGQLQAATNALYSALTFQYQVEGGAYIPPSKKAGIIATSCITVFDRYVLVVS